MELKLLQRYFTPEEAEMEIHLQMFPEPAAVSDSYVRSMNSSTWPAISSPLSSCRKWPAPLITISG